MRKAALRKLYLDKRAGLSLQAYQLKNQQLAQQFFDFFSAHHFHAVHSFLPIPLRREPDTWPMVRHLQHQGVMVVVSKSDLQENRLYHYPLTTETVLKPNRWGVPEPAAHPEEFPIQKIDAVLVPLLVFDQQGHRVGYGKGYYDRFLEQCRPDTIKIGLSLEAPVISIEDTHALDVRLDYCLTPEQVWSFQA